jgi:Tol biopolymer transport system component
MSDRCVLRTAVCAAVLLSAGFAQASQVDLVSKRHPSFDSAEVVGDGREAAVSADGRWIAFSSTSPNLAPGQSDGNAGLDVFLLDRLSGDITLVSRVAGFPNTTGVGASSSPSISADGRYVVFQSGSSNLIPGQASTSFSSNVFLYDRIDDSLTLISHADGSATAAGNSGSSGGKISKDGSYIVFSSAATNLVPGVADTNGKTDVFLYDLAAGTLNLVSRSAASAGTAANSQSAFPTINADGRYILFNSTATDVVSGQTDPNTGLDLFLYDRDSGANTLVSHAVGFPAKTGNAPCSEGVSSDDGAYVVFTSGATDMVAGQVDSASVYSDAFLYERATGTVTLLSHGDGAPVTAAGSHEASISADGAWIALESSGTNLVPGQIDTNSAPDIFLVQRATGAVTLVSRQSGTAATTGNGWQYSASLSSDGRHLTFSSESTNLVAGQTDTNGAYDLFLFDRLAGTTVLASHADGSSSTAADGASYSGGLSADGSHVIYLSLATDLTDAGIAASNGEPQLFVFSAGSNASVSLSEPVVRATPDDSTRGFPSRDGRFVALSSWANDLVEGQSDTADSLDVFLVDRLAGTTTLVSHAAGSPATAANNDAYSPWISGDGKWIVFESEATDLIPGIGQPGGFPRYNVFLYGRESGTLTLVSHSASDPNLSANAWSSQQVINGDGRYVAFSSKATNLVTGQVDAPAGHDVFLYDRVTGGISLASHAPADPLQAVNAPGTNAPRVGISFDGSHVLFQSLSGSLVSGQAEGNSGNDLFLYGRVTGAVTLVSRSAASPTTTANTVTDFELPALSADGRFVAFASAATDLVPGQVDTNGGLDLFLFDRVAGTVTLVSRKSGTAATTGDRGCFSVYWISDDGRYLAFSSWASDLVPGQIDLNQAADAFLYDRMTGTVSLLTQDGFSTDPTAATYSYSLSPDGRFVAVSSQETQRIPGQADQNGRGEDLFVIDRLAGTTRLASRSRVSPLTTANHSAGISWFAGGGHLLFFHSGASDLVEGDWNQQQDLFVSSAGSTPATDFFTLTPCRVADTRATGSLASGAAVLFDLHGVCGIPATALAVALNVTAVQGSGPGHLTLYPGDAEPPLASAISFQAGQTRASNAILALANDGTLAALPTITGGGTVHLVLDVVGWFE